MVKDGSACKDVLEKRIAPVHGKVDLRLRLRACRIVTTISGA